MLIYLLTEDCRLGPALIIVLLVKTTATLNLGLITENLRGKKKEKKE